jgi:uncharacterized membrane protein YgcG
MADKRLGILVTLKDAASAGFLGLSGKIKSINKEVVEHNKKMMPLKNLYRNTATAMAPYTAAAKMISGAMIGAGAASIALAVKAAQTADSFKDMSQRTGIAVETLSRWSYAAKLSGTSIEKIQFGLKNFSQNLTKTNQKTTDLNTNFGKLGIETRDAAGNIRPMDDVLLDVADKFKTMPDGAQKAALAVQLFGKSGMELIPMLNEGREGIERMNREADLFRVTIGQDAADAGSRLADNIDRLRAFTTGLVNTFGAQMFPALNTLLENFFGNEEAVKMFQIAAVKMAALVGKSMLTLIPIMMSVGVGILDIAGATMETLSTITGGAKKIFDFMASISSDDKAAFYKRQSAWLGEMQSGLDAGTDKIAEWRYGLEKAAQTAEDVLAPAIYEISQSEQKIISDIKSGKKLIAAKTGPQGKGLGDDVKTEKLDADGLSAADRKAIESAKATFDYEMYYAESEAIVTKEINDNFNERMFNAQQYYNETFNMKGMAIQQEQYFQDQLKFLHDNGIISDSQYSRAMIQNANRVKMARLNAWGETLDATKDFSKNAGKLLGLGNKDQAKVQIPLEIALAAIETAKGIGTVMTNPAESITHFSAAAAHGVAIKELIAAASGKGGSGKSSSSGGGYSGGGGYGGSGAGRSGRAENALRGAHGSAVINIDLGPLANDDNVVTGLGKFTEKIVVQAVNQGNKGRVKVNYV